MEDHQTDWKEIYFWKHWKLLELSLSFKMEISPVSDENIIGEREIHRYREMQSFWKKWLLKEKEKDWHLSRTNKIAIDYFFNP